MVKVKKTIKEKEEKSNPVKFPGQAQSKFGNLRGNPSTTFKPPTNTFRTQHKG